MVDPEEQMVDPEEQMVDPECQCSVWSGWSLTHVVIPILHEQEPYSGPSLSGHSQPRPSLYEVTNICHCYQECIYFSLSPKATSVLWPQFLGKQCGRIRGVLVISACILLSAHVLRSTPQLQTISIDPAFSIVPALIYVTGIPGSLFKLLTFKTQSKSELLEVY